MRLNWNLMTRILVGVFVVIFLSFCEKKTCLVCETCINCMCHIIQNSRFARDARQERYRFVGVSK